MNMDELKKKLNPKHVKSRKKGNTNLSYIEAWHAIDEANNIFGFDNWSRETIYNREVCRYDYTIAAGSKYEAPGHKVGYEAKVQITVGGVVREGTGHGSGIAKDLFDAIESAGKEAESDAMKRAFMTFGNRFGLALYDKTQANVGVDIEPDVIAQKLKDKVDTFLVTGELLSFEKKKPVAQARDNLPQKLREEVSEYIKNKYASFTSA